MSTNPPPGEQDIESTLGHLSKADLLTLIKRMVQLYLDSRNPTTPGSCNG